MKAYVVQILLEAIVQPSTNIDDGFNRSKAFLALPAYMISNAHQTLMSFFSANQKRCFLDQENLLKNVLINVNV